MRQGLALKLPTRIFHQDGVGAHAEIMYLFFPYSHAIVHDTTVDCRPSIESIHSHDSLGNDDMTNVRMISRGSLTQTPSSQHCSWG